MSAEILTFQRQDNAEPEPKFHCALDVVNDCFAHIGIACSEHFAQRFVDKMELSGYAIVPFWVLSEKGPA